MIAPAALLLWPFLGLILFALLGPTRGLIWSTAIGYLFLPEAYQIDLPVLPSYDKFAAVALSGVLGMVFFCKRLPVDGLHLAAPMLRRLMVVCFMVLFVAPIMTVLSNGEAIVDGSVIRPGLRLWDAVSTSADMLIRLVPFLLAWRYLGRIEDIRELLLAIVSLGLGYTVLVLFEIRMSPQLHVWTYGYFQHSWIQHIRDGNFRPLVFLRHGLWLGFFLLSVAIAAFALSRQNKNKRPVYLAIGLWTAGVLLISSNLGATFLCIIFGPAVFFLPRRGQLLLVSAAAVVLLSYPMLKHYSATPVDRVLVLAERISPQRAQSFQFRLNHETELLDRALEKPLFGWGGWNRGRIYDERGQDQSTTDGAWIIIFGQHGWVGYLAFFGLLTLPVLSLGRTARRKDVPPIVTGIALMSAANYIYMIPNSTLSPIGLLALGALAAFAQYDERREPNTKPGKSKLQVRDAGPRLTRFPDGLSPVTSASREASGVRETSPSAPRYRRDTSPKDA